VLPRRPLACLTFLLVAITKIAQTVLLVATQKFQSRLMVYNQKIQALLTKIQRVVLHLTNQRERLLLQTMLLVKPILEELRPPMQAEHMECHLLGSVHSLLVIHLDLVLQL